MWYHRGAPHIGLAGEERWELCCGCWEGRSVLVSDGQGLLQAPAQKPLQDPGAKHDPSVHPSSALLLSAQLSPSSLFLYLLGYLCAGFTLVCWGDFKAGGDVSIFQPNREVRDTLGSPGATLQEAASEAFQKTPVFLGNTSAFREFPKLRVLLSGKFHKNKNKSPAGIVPSRPRKASPRVCVGVESRTRG